MDESLDQLREKLGDEPTNGEVWAEYAKRLLYDVGDAAQALDALETAQRLLPGKDLRRYIGTALVKSGERGRGIDLLMDYLKDNLSAKGYLYVSSLYEDVGDIEQARGVLEQSLESWIYDNSIIFEYLGFYSYELSDVPAAIEYYREALARDNDSDFAWRGLGVALSRSAFSVEDFEDERRVRAESLRALKRAVRLDPDNPNSAFVLAISLWMNGCHRLADTHFQTAIRLDPSDQSFIDEYKKFKSIDEYKKFKS